RARSPLPGGRRARLGQQRLQLHESRTGRVGLENFMSPVPAGARDAATLEDRETPPHGGMRKIELAGQVRDGPPPSGVRKKSRQYETSRSRKENFQRQHGTGMNSASSLPLVICKSHKTAIPRRFPDRRSDSRDRAGRRVHNSTSGRA